MDSTIPRKRIVPDGKVCDGNPDRSRKKLKSVEYTTDSDTGPGAGEGRSSDGCTQDAKLRSQSPEKIQWRKLEAENLDADYCILYTKREASDLLTKLESEIVWNTGKDSKVHIFGKWHDIPRKQAAYGDDGLSYTFSGHTVPAKPWTPVLKEIRDQIQEATGHSFNFVLVNRYKDGNDHIGEHQDDEKDLVRESPIASLSLGQPRDFVFRHGESRGKRAKRRIEPVKIELAHGSLLMMNFPTNVYWYHSLPVRKKCLGTRMNLTFRDFVRKPKIASD